jgi:hypothetical protein
MPFDSRNSPNLISKIISKISIVASDSNYLKSDELGQMIFSAKNTKDFDIYGWEVELRNSGKVLSPENASVKECN